MVLVLHGDGVGVDATAGVELASVWLAASTVELADDDSLEDSIEVEEDDEELELDDLDEALGLLDDDCLVATLTWTLAWLCAGCKKTIAKAKRIAGRVNAKIR